MKRLSSIWCHLFACLSAQFISSLDCIAIRPPCRVFISSYVFLLFLQSICNLLTYCNCWDYWPAFEDCPRACFVRKSVVFGTLTKSHSGVGPVLHSGSLVYRTGQFSDCRILFFLESYGLYYCLLIILKTKDIVPIWIYMMTFQLLFYVCFILVIYCKASAAQYCLFDLKSNHFCLSTMPVLFSDF